MEDPPAGGAEHDSMSGDSLDNVDHGSGYDSGDFGDFQAGEIDLEIPQEQFDSAQNLPTAASPFFVLEDLYEDDIEAQLGLINPNIPKKRPRCSSSPEYQLTSKRSRSQSPREEDNLINDFETDRISDESEPDVISSKPESASEDDWDMFIYQDEMAPASNWEEEFKKHKADMLERFNYRGLVDDDMCDSNNLQDEPWHPYDPGSLSIVGATLQEEALPASVGFEMICYGMIHKVRVRVLPYSLQLLKFMQISQTTLTTFEKQDIYVFKISRDGDSERFLLRPQISMANDDLQPYENAAVINRQTSSIIAQIASYCTFEAYVPVGRWNSAIGGSTTIDKDTCIEVEIVLYGLRKDCQDVGDILELRDTHLQEPDYYDNSVGYRNPHFMDLTLIQPSANGVLPAARPSLLQTGDVFQQLQISDEQTSSDTQLKQKIAAAFKSTTRAQNLKRVQADIHISTSLKPYQEEALDFIMQRESGPIPEEYCLWRPKDLTTYTNAITGDERVKRPMELGGGILADEMGLGKTLTMLSAISRTIDEAKNFARNYQNSKHLSVGQTLIASRATLVVVPSPLLLNEWLQEIKLHCTGFGQPTIYHGHGREGNAKVLADSDIVLSTYHTIASESTDNTSPIWKIKWFRIVLDEAHIIRRVTTKLFKAIKKLRATLRWCLTGTPIQNSLEDLAALVNFIRSSPLDDLPTFKKHIITPLLKKQEKGLDNLRLLLDSVCLRRTKELLKLPDIVYEPRLLEFSGKEREQYVETRDRLIKEINKNHLQPHQKGYLGVFQLQLQLRRLCNHGTFQKSSIGAEDFDPEQAIAELRKQKQAKCEVCKNSVTGIHGIEEQRSGSFTTCGHLLCSKCIPQMKQALTAVDGCDGCLKCSLCPDVIFGEYIVSEEAPPQAPKRGTRHLSAWQYFDKAGCSTKVSAVVADIEQHQTMEEKSIVFSCWTRTLDLVGIFLASRKVAFVRIDGSHTIGQRKKILENYQKYPDIKILLMTTGTGAVGLNLTAANCVYILEPQWNPMIETQAIARVNRLGQTRDVRVVRYIMKGTVEELELQSQQLRKLEYAKVGWAKEE